LAGRLARRITRRFLHKRRSERAPVQEAALH
jgi:hypothetical protein